MRYAKAALRWHARYCAEVVDVSFAEGSAVLALLSQLGGDAIGLAANSLQALFEARGQRLLAAELARWSESGARIS